MMYNESFRLSAKAKKDLIKIAKGSEKQWGRQRRNLYLKLFDDAFHLLAERPFIGKPCDLIKTDYRKYPQGSHIIFYKPGEHATIEIVRILHKHMDIQSKLT